MKSLKRCFTVSNTLLIIRPDCRVEHDYVLCQQNGVTAIAFSPIKIVENTAECFRLPEKIAQAQAIFWVSQTAVQTALPYLSGSLNKNQHIAVGRATASLLAAHGIQASCSQTGNDSEAALKLPIWQMLPHQANILIIRGNGGREQLSNALRQLGFHVQYAEIYSRQIQTLDWTRFEASQPRFAWITSSEMAIQLFEQCPLHIAQELQSLLYFTHHERIAATLRLLGATHVKIVNNLIDALDIIRSTLETPNDRTSKFAR